MNLKNINSYNELSLLLKENSKSFLLLYKNGNEQSECALNNLINISIDNVNIYTVDVSIVRDVHTVYTIKTAPSFLEFLGETLENIYKGCHEAEFYNNIIVGSVYSNHSSDDKPKKRVTVYSTPSCSWCTRLKSYLDSKGVKYRDIDISKDAKAAENLVKRSGQQGVPQTEINGKIIVGFDQAKIDSMLEI